MSTTTSEYIDGTIIFTDNSSSVVKTVFTSKFDYLDEISTIVNHTSATRELCQSEDLARITVKLIPSIRSFKIEEFYVNTNTVSCRMSPSERNAYKRLGEVIFSLMFNHIGHLLDDKTYSQYQYVIADVVDLLYKSTKKGNCALLDKIYYNKYKFQEVKIKIDDSSDFVTLNDEQIKKCYDIEHRSLHVRSTIEHVLSILDNYRDSYDLYKLSKTK